MNQDELLHISDFFIILIRRKLLFLGVWLLILGVAIAYALFAPKSYQLTGTLYIGRLQHSLLEEGEFVAQKLQDYSFVSQALARAKVDPGKPVSRLIRDIQAEVVNEIKKDEDVGIVQLTVEARTPELTLAIYKALTTNLIEDHQQRLATGQKVFKDMEAGFWKDEERLRLSLEKDEALAANASAEIAKDSVPSFLLLGHTIAEKRSNHQLLVKDIHYLKLEGDSPTKSFNTRLAAEPTLPDEPFKPKKMLIAILGVILATMSAVCAVFALEFYAREISPRL